MMRHFHLTLAVGAALSALMFSCTTEFESPEVDITSVRCSISQIDVEEDFATGFLDTLFSTKATFSGSNFLWSEGDKIGIIPTKGSQIYFAVDNGAGTSTASFNGGDWAMKSTGTFYAYYPLYPDIFLSKDHVPVSYTGQTQSGNNNNLHTGDYWTLYTEGTPATGNTLNFSFNHLTSFFKTYVTVPAGTYTKIAFSAPSEVFIKEGYFDLGAQIPAIVGTSFTDELSLDLQNVTFTEDTELTGYLVVAPIDITGIPITVTVYKDGEAAYEYTLTKTSPMVAAKTYAFRATALTQVVSSVSQANALFASGEKSVTITDPLTEDATVILPNTEDAVTLTLPTTSSTSTLTVSYAQDATAYPATLSITGPEGSNLDIYAPNSTVTVNGVSYNQITSRTAANTCIIPAGVSVNILKVVQGGVEVYGTVSQIDLSEQEDDAVIYALGTVTTLLGEDDEEYIPATGVSVSPTSINLTVGATETLTATVTPVGAYPNVVWSSSDEAVATVSATGVVTAVAEGSATITAKTISGGFSAICSVFVLPLDYATTPFTITSIGNTSVAIVNNSSSAKIALEYKVGSNSWSSYTINSTIDLSNGESLQFRAEGNDGGFSASGNIYRVTVSGNGTVVVSGNIMSLLDKSLQKDSVYSSVFRMLFENCTKLIDASNLKLPVTSFRYSTGCYAKMFLGCTNLTSAPELPATILDMNCYRNMFEGCTNLTMAPELPATTLADGCYAEMFKGSTNLTTAPSLPAESLSVDCYKSMFEGCISLTTAPELPASHLVHSCYGGMFKGCTSLTTAPSLPAQDLDVSCYESMFEGCTSLIDVPDLTAIYMANRCYYSMFRGCSSLTNAPRIYATTLESECFYYMFYNCSCLNYIWVDFTKPYYVYLDEDDNSYVAVNVSHQWLYGVSSTGRFNKPFSGWYERGDSGIPEGWIVEPEYVDLGLSVKWATVNLGASSPEEFGDYYAWGETKAYGQEDQSNANNYSYTSSYTKDNYSVNTYKWYDNSTEKYTKYCTNSSTGIVDNKIILEKEDDAAYVNLGENWRMPSLSEFEELRNSDNCSWTWYDETNTEYNGVRGYKIQSLKPGYTDKYIFLPVSRVRREGQQWTKGCGYWTSSLYQYNWGAHVERINAYASSDWGYIEDNDYSYGRSNGYNIRPVYSEDPTGGITGVSLDKTSLTMSLGEIVSLHVTVSTIQGGVNRSVVWSTSDPTVTSIDGSYYSSCDVTAKTVGTSTVTVRTAMGGFEATCTINVVAPPEVDADYVDLGLPSGTLWAAYNIGATAPEEPGGFFAWGETVARTVFYDWVGYKFSKGSSSTITKYKSGNAILESIDDAAYLNWGSHWRMPTKKEWDELIANCIWTWTTQNGANGYLITSNTNSNSIFLPAAGFCESRITGKDTNGYYWSSTQCYSTSAYYLQFSSGSKTIGTNIYRCYGMPVRAVREQ